MLDYLQGRLAARDLSAEEALAMLGAVHEQLTNPANADRGVYQKYSEFMEALRTQMPDVHDYVVSAWEQRAENKDKADGEDERGFDDVEGNENLEIGDAKSESKSESGSPEVGVASEEGGGEDADEAQSTHLQGLQILSLRSSSASRSLHYRSIVVSSAGIFIAKNSRCIIPLLLQQTIWSYTLKSAFREVSAWTIKTKR